MANTAVSGAGAGGAIMAHQVQGRMNGQGTATPCPAPVMAEPGGQAALSCGDRISREGPVIAFGLDPACDAGSAFPPTGRTRPIRQIDPAGKGTQRVGEGEIPRLKTQGIDRLLTMTEGEVGGRHRVHPFFPH